MSLKSWPTYENYTGNLGVQTLTDILYAHYGPNPASQDNNGWGQWTRADHEGIGMYRTVWNGTANSGQYPDEVANLYECPETTPDELMLWFHHVPYTFQLHSGETVIQHFYDAHYDGAETAQTFSTMSESLRGRIDKERFEHELFRLQYQAGHSIVWRDAITEFYRNLSGIPDDSKRVRSHPYRIEAEKMELRGYSPVNIQSSIAASGYTAMVTNGTGTATTKLLYPSGSYNLAVNYFDVHGGQASYEVYLRGRWLGAWKGDSEKKLGHWSSDFIDAHSARRITFRGIHVEEGDELFIRGTANGAEQAPLDYIAVLPPHVVD